MKIEKILSNKRRLVYLTFTEIRKSTSAYIRHWLNR